MRRTELQLRLRRERTLALLLISFVCGRGAAEPAMAEEEGVISRIDELFARAMTENYRAEGRTLMAEDLSLCERALSADQTDYELLWRSARAAVELTECARILRAPDWKELCDALAPKALTWSEAARASAPGRVEGYFWHLQIAGIAYDADGLTAFVAKGLPAQVRRDIEACAATDPSYLDHTVLLAEALYYVNLPLLWGKDIDKALTLYRQFAARTSWGFETYRQLPRAAELLMATKRQENLAEARSLLLRALADPTPRPYYHDLAAKLLASTESAGAGQR